MDYNTGEVIGWHTAWSRPRAEIWPVMKQNNETRQKRGDGRGRGQWVMNVMAAVLAVVMRCGQRAQGSALGSRRVAAACLQAGWTSTAKHDDDPRSALPVRVLVETLCPRCQ